MACTLKPEYRKCHICGNEAEVIGDRALTALDIPELKDASGPVCYGVVMLCTHCVYMWIVLAAETGCWYGVEGSD